MTSRREVPANPGAPRPHGITDPRGGPLGRRRGTGWRWWAPANENGREQQQQQQQQQQEHHQPGGATSSVSSEGPSFWYQQTLKVYPVKAHYSGNLEMRRRSLGGEGGGGAAAPRRTGKRSTTCRKLGLLMWKNVLVQIRKKCQTAAAILVPLITFFFLMIVRMLLPPESKHTQYYKAFCPLNSPLLCDHTIFVDYTIHNGGDYPPVPIVFYSPTGNSAIEKTMGLLMLWVKVRFPTAGYVQGFASETDLERHLVTNNLLNSKILAYVFDDRLKDGTELPDDTEVKIRFPGKLKKKPNNSIFEDWHTDRLFPFATLPGPRQYQLNDGAEPVYYDEGFLSAQTMLTYYLIYGQLGATQLGHIIDVRNDRKERVPLVGMQRFPHAKWIADPQLAFMGILLAFALVVGFLFAFIQTVAAITLEKERQLKEMMKMMGLSNWIHWTAWFITSFLLLLIIVGIITFLVRVPCRKNYGIYTFADPSVIFLFLLVAACSIITLAFMASVFFSSANQAAYYSGFFLMISFIPYLYCKLKKTTNLAARMTASLGCGSAMAFGVDLMMDFERTVEGIRWNNIFRTASPEDNLTLGYLAIMLIVDTFLYMFIALYVEAVFPGQYGVPQPWNYLCKSAYWRGQPTEADADAAGPIKKMQEYFEKEPKLEPGVQIRKLRKVFGNMPAVRNLTLNMYKDQITVLLGHNGAGKTTAMSMLTGMFPPTSGTAKIQGHDIRTDMDGARSSMGLCRQQNVLFDDLTVRENLVFFTKLKGLEKAHVRLEVDSYIKLMELTDKEAEEKQVRKLSGGMKRKLSIGIAMCGYSKVVILDEPTAGMDPWARKTIWELIQKQKGGRTILLITNFMDEADLLGDRIAIMAGGELQCCGSSFFLKKKYGTGYHLIINKEDECDPSKITKELKNYIPSIEIYSDAGSELTYLLVEKEADVFEAMLRRLEDHSETLGIRSYGISLTTLEDVFMKVEADQDQEESYNKAPGDKKKSKNPLKRNEEKNSRPTETKVTVISKGSNRLDGCDLTRNQFSAMCTKRFLSRKRSWIVLLVQFLLPVALTILAFLHAERSDAGALPKLSLSLKSYKDPITLVENTANTIAKELRDIFVDVLTSSGGKIENVDSIRDVMTNLSRTAPSTVKRRYILGASFESKEGSSYPLDIRGKAKIIIWFNNEPLHSPPLALGMAMNSVYKYMLYRRIRFANHPLPFKSDDKMKHMSRLSGLGIDVASCLVLALAIVSALHAPFYVRERVCKSKHLQFISGVKTCIFWLCALLCDLAVYLLVFLLVIITIACFQEDGYKTPSDLGRFSLLLLCYAVAVLPLIYVASFWSNVPSAVLRILLVIFIIIGVFAVLIMALIKKQHFKWFDILHMVLLIEPHYSLATGIIDIYRKSMVNKICRDFMKTCTEQGGHDCRALACKELDSCCGKMEHNYFEWQSTGILKNLCFSFGIGTVMFLLLLMIDCKCFSKLQCTGRQNDKSDVDDKDVDSDVFREKQMIRKTDAGTLQRQYAIVLSNVTKHYDQDFCITFPAVKDLWLGIKRSECFGFLGVNGAGKTTTFQMMTGDAKMSSGDVWINGFNVKTQLGKVYENIGYCPQLDALLDEMTAKETLTMFALLRGEPRDECAPLAERLAVDFGFRRHLDKQIKNLSGDNKRKVSTAVAMIGDPPVVFLDEPTAGMDPATKRQVWNVICRARDSGKCIVLTSQSIEECEALCTRLVVMVAGRFKCLGSVQHLKNKFAAGHTLTIKVKKTSTRSSSPSMNNRAAVARNLRYVRDFVKKNLPSAKLKGIQEEMLTYNILDMSMPWSRMFGILQRAKEKLNIEDYSLGQSGLKQVFLSFTTNEAKGRRKHSIKNK